MVAGVTAELLGRTALDHNRRDVPTVVRRTAVQTAVHVITTGLLIALLVGIATKLRWLGPNP